MHRSRASNREPGVASVPMKSKWSWLTWLFEPSVRTLAWWIVLVAQIVVFFAHGETRTVFGWLAVAGWLGVVVFDQDFRHRLRSAAFGRRTNDAKSKQIGS